MKYKYVILDFGKVIAGPTTGNWDITPKFLELIDIKKINMQKFKLLRKKYEKVLSEKVRTLEEEFNMFYRFYNDILSEMGFDSSVAKKIAYDRTYNSNKYFLYDGIYKELDFLKEKYILILLTDNWPCVYEYLKEQGLSNYFDKIYVSSIYGVEKKDKLFFYYPIAEFDIKPGEALFIDDNELNLKIGKEMGFEVLLMDRDNEVNDCQFRVINNLFNI